MKNQRNRKLTDAEKEKQFERLIDWAYRKVYEVKEENWETEYNKTDALTNIAIEKAKNSNYLRFRSSVNKYLL